MSTHLLQDLLTVGRRMHDALENRDLEAYFELVDERGTLLDRVLAEGHPTSADAEWTDAASTLTRQNRELMKAAASHRRQMQESMTRIEQIKSARRAYRQPPERTGILHEQLRV